MMARKNHVTVVFGAQHYPGASANGNTGDGVGRTVAGRLKILPPAAFRDYGSLLEDIRSVVHCVVATNLFALVSAGPHSLLGKAWTIVHRVSQASALSHGQTTLTSRLRAIKSTPPPPQSARMARRSPPYVTHLRVRSILSCWSASWLRLVSDELGNLRLDSRTARKPSARQADNIPAVPRCNDQYGWAMSLPLPIRNFIWVDTNIDVMSIPDDAATGYTLEHPTTIHEEHRDLPFLPINQCPPGSKHLKLMTTLEDKKKYIVHYRNLKQAFEHGLKLTKIHRVLTFEQSPWLKPYIELNTTKRRPPTTLRRNSSNERIMQHLENLWKIPIFLDRTAYKENLFLLPLQHVIRFDKPIYAGLIVLDLSKTLMLQKKLEVTASQLCVPSKGAGVAKRLACLPPTKVNRVQYPAGLLLVFSTWGNPVRRCYWSASFLWDLPFPPILSFRSLRGAWARHRQPSHHGGKSVSKLHPKAQARVKPRSHFSRPDGELLQDLRGYVIWVISPQHPEVTRTQLYRNNINDPATATSGAFWDTKRVRHIGESGSIPCLVAAGFRIWELCLTMVLASGFPRGSPVSLPFHSSATPHSP
ncbi:hypothetical protein PR048_007293 [Dryococelus australis]|uniref:Uncharacterized protein n=1 Tax=Dryococelus australis TaxID=614101 RepID=A0ABQ9ID84_9NEOP|nr:hypothetical protein PR048_007293 [Dryococelus australis]